MIAAISTRRTDRRRPAFPGHLIAGLYHFQIGVILDLESMSSPAYTRRYLRGDGCVRSFCPATTFPFSG